MSYFNFTISAQAKACRRSGSRCLTRKSSDVWRRPWVLTDPDLFETDTGMLDKLLEQAKPGLTFGELAEAGTIFHPADPVVQFEHHDYRTRSGKIELAGSAFIDAGLPRAPFASAEARPEGGQLRLLSPASKWLMNSSFGNDPKNLKQLGVDEAFVHPDEARTRGIADGARVRIGNPTGDDYVTACRFGRRAEGRHSGSQEPLDGYGVRGQRQRPQSRQQGRSRR